jgi:hypothetical protein
MLINGLGITSKLIGFLLFASLTYLGYQVARAIEQFPPATQWVKDNMQLTLADQQGILLLTGVGFGFISMFLFWLAGTIVSAVGQILKAILDTAVNTSPFLTPEEKQRIIP